MFQFIIPDVVRKNRLDPQQVYFFVLWITVLCLSFTLLHSTPLWLRDNRLFGLSPIIPITTFVPVWIDPIMLVGALLATWFWAIKPQKRVLFALIFPLFLILWVLQDSLRWQPFLYMYAFTMLVLAYTPLPNAKTNTSASNPLLPLHIMVSGVYFWAGIGKVNVYFYEVIFPWFVSTWLPFPELVHIGAYIVPWIEAFIGVFLLFRITRPLALGMAFAMLIVVLISLGPSGHGWGTIVWPWNIFLFSITFVLFLPELEQNIWHHSALRRPLSIIAIILFGLLPLLGQFGYWGAHPSFKLYSGDVPVGIVHLAEDEDISSLPVLIQEVLEDDNSFDITTWTIQELSIASTPSIPSYGHYLTGAKVLCPYLKKPDKAYLTLQHWKRPNADHPEVFSQISLCTEAKHYE